MDKNKFLLQGKKLEGEMYYGEGCIRFEWNMLYQCNYRCPHCFFKGHWEEYGKKTVFASVEEWTGIWKKLYDKYGRSCMVITGGEPFIYPGFVKLIEKLSQMHYPINISTNASGDLQEFVKAADPQKVSLTLSFHPEYMTLDEIIDRKAFLEDHGFRSDYINLCAYPPYFKEMGDFIEKAHKRGTTLKVIPFVGEYDGRQYPAGYSKEENDLLGIDTAWHDNVVRKGTLCAAGQKSALIFPDGKVARCGQIGERFLLGNIFSGGFELLKKPMVCDAQMCPCLETVPVEKEQS